MSGKSVTVNEGDVVVLKAASRGTNRWTVIRVGMDIGLTCQGCGRKVMLVRSEFERRYKSHLSYANPYRKNS